MTRSQAFSIGANDAVTQLSTGCSSVVCTDGLTLAPSITRGETGVRFPAGEPGWCHAPVIQKKSDGKYRFCIDFRDLNARSKKDAYPIPNMDAILDKLRRAKYISQLDLKNAYFQIPLDEESRQYTAFAVPGSGLWQFKRMHFGLTGNRPTAYRLAVWTRDGT